MRMDRGRQVAAPTDGDGERAAGEDSPGGGNVREADKRGEEPFIPNEMAESAKLILEFLAAIGVSCFRNIAERKT